MRFVLSCLLAPLLLVGCGDVSGSKQGGVVTLAPHITETVFALGEGDRVVGVGNFCDFPREIEPLPRLGGYLDPNLEQIAMMKPDVVILPGAHEKASAFAALHQIPVLNIHMDSFATIDEGIREIGEALHCPEAAAELQKKMRQEMDKLRTTLAGVTKPKVLIVTSRHSHDLNAINTSGTGSFVSEMVELAGGQNIFADNASAYFEASKEDIVARAPDAIIEFHCGESLTQNQQQAFYNDWQALNTLPAVQHGRIYFVFESYGLRPGPRVVDVARQLAAVLHPMEVAAL